MHPSDGAAEAEPGSAPFPDVDARTVDAISEDQLQFFRDHGLLVIRNVLHGEELSALQRETQSMIEVARRGVDDPDYRYVDHQASGQRVPFRIEYIVDKSQACRSLLGHPYILRMVAKLLGPDFISTAASPWYSRIPGAGAAIPWHRDAGASAANKPIGWKPTFNVDLYLDRSVIDNCLWGIRRFEPLERWRGLPAVIAELNANGLLARSRGDPDPDGALVTSCSTIPPPCMDRLPPNPSSGASSTTSSGRRLLSVSKAYYVPEYCPWKQNLIRVCQRQRSRMEFARGERPFVLNDADASPLAAAPDEQLP